MRFTTLLDGCIRLHWCTVASMKPVKHYCNTDGVCQWENLNCQRIWETFCCAEQYLWTLFQKADRTWRSISHRQSLTSLISVLSTCIKVNLNTIGFMMLTSYLQLMSSRKSETSSVLFQQLWKVRTGPVVLSSIKIITPNLNALLKEVIFWRVLTSVYYVAFAASVSGKCGIFDETKIVVNKG